MTLTMSRPPRTSAAALAFALSLGAVSLGAAPALAADLTPALPEGRLTPVAADSHKNFLYLALDETRASGTVRELTIMAMMDPPQDLDGGAASMLVFRAQVDCVSHQSTVLGSASFDVQGRLLKAGPGWGPDPIEDNTPFKLVEAAVCHPETFDAADGLVVGHVAAQAANAKSVRN